MSGYGKAKSSTYVKDCLTLDVTELNLEAGEGKVFTGGGIELGYELEGNSLQLFLFSEGRREELYEVSLTWTSCNFGGQRPWFKCPSGVCDERVSKLYLPPEGKRFLCRHCHGLSYESQGRSNKFYYENVTRWKKKCEKMLENLEVDPIPPLGDFPIEPGRPKGMERSKYQDLLEDYTRYYEKLTEGFRAFSKLLEEMVENG